MTHRRLGAGGYDFGGPRLRAETLVRNVSAKVGTSACRHGLARGAPLEESQNKNWDGCPLFFIRGKDQDIERLKRGGCYERKKQRGKGKQEGAAEKP